MNESGELILEGRIYLMNNPDSLRLRIIGTNKTQPVGTRLTGGMLPDNLITPKFSLP